MQKEIICKPKPYAKEIGKKLGEIRQAKGLTIEQVAELAGYRPGTIHSIEIGKYNYGVEQFGTVAKVLGCKIEIKSE